MNKRIFGILIGIIVVVAIVLAVRAEQPTTDNVITIGVILPITGEYGYLGENVVKGIRLAEAELEAETGLAINIIVEDDVLDSAKGLSAYHKLVNIDGIDALIMGSAPSFDVIYDDAKSRNLPVIAINTETRDESNDNVFAIRPAANEVSDGLAKHIQTLAPTKIVAVRSNDSLISKLGTIFDTALGTSPTVFTINRGSNDYPTTATKILAENPDLIVISAYAQDGALLVKELTRQAGDDMPQIAFDSIFNENVLEYENIIADMTVLDGSIVTVLKSELSPTFVTAFKTMHNEEPGALADLGYDSLLVLVARYDADPTDWISNMSKTQGVAGASSEISFDSIGLRKAEFRIDTMKDGAVPAF